MPAPPNPRYEYATVTLPYKQITGINTSGTSGVDSTT